MSTKKKVSKKPRLKRPSRYTWRDAPDSVLLSHLPDSHELDRAESLCPTVSTIQRYVDGEETARGVIDAWCPDYSSLIVEVSA
jgi:hypothetical protein